MSPASTAGLTRGFTGHLGFMRPVPVLAGLRARGLGVVSHELKQKKQSWSRLSRYGEESRRRLGGCGTAAQGGSGRLFAVAAAGAGNAGAGRGGGGGGSSAEGS